jgi:hypothetical protein
VFDATAHQCALRVLNYSPLEYYEDAGDAGGGDTKNKTLRSLDYCVLVRGALLNLKL